MVPDEITGTLKAPYRVRIVMCIISRFQIVMAYDLTHDPFSFFWRAVLRCLEKERRLERRKKQESRKMKRRKEEKRRRSVNNKS